MKYLDHESSRPDRANGRDRNCWQDEAGVPVISPNKSNPQRVLAFLERLDEPITVDVVTDHLLHSLEGPHFASEIERWGDTHEVLTRELLPELDSRGDVRFDSQRGVVRPSNEETSPPERSRSLDSTPNFLSRLFASQTWDRIGRRHADQG